MTSDLEDSNGASHARAEAVRYGQTQNHDGFVQNGTAHLPFQQTGHLNDKNVTSAHKREVSRRTRLYSGKRPELLTPKRFRSLSSEVVVLSVLGIASFLGTLARLGLNAINTYPGQPVFPLIWAQMLGCAVMGAATTRSKQIGSIYPHLYVGITTGFCGSTTTFSAWMAQIFEAFAQIDSPPHGGFYNVSIAVVIPIQLAERVLLLQLMAGLSRTIVTLGASVAAFTFGTHIGPLLFPHSHGRHRSHIEHDTSAIATSRLAAHSTANSHEDTYFILHCALAVTFLAMYVCLAVLAACKPEWRGIVLFGLIFAPWGTWLRFYLSRINTMERFAEFPLGTFSANMFGTAVIAGCTALQYTGPGFASLLHCEILQGFDDGFCGCLTTVSTFVAEVRKLPQRSSYIYAISSWACGQLLLLVILGTVDFTRGGLGGKCSFG